VAHDVLRFTRRGDRLRTHGGTRGNFIEEDTLRGPTLRQPELATHHDIRPPWSSRLETQQTTPTARLRHDSILPEGMWKMSEEILTGPPSRGPWLHAFGTSASRIPHTLGANIGGHADNRIDDERRHQRQRAGRDRRRSGRKTAWSRAEFRAKRSGQHG